MKKFKVALAAIAMMLVTVFCLAACDKGNYSETFAGKLSDETYETADSAMKDFVQTEFAGSTSTVSFVGAETEKTLTQEEIAELDLGEDVKNVVSVEKMKVTYSMNGNSSAVATAADTLPDAYITVCYIVKIGRDDTPDEYYYRYFVPMASTGEMISKSYYDDVMLAEKYKNCTETLKMTVKVKVAIISITQEVTYTLKITEDVAYMQVTSGGTVGDTYKGITGDYYFVNSTKGNGVIQYFRATESSSWSAGRLSGYSTLAELVNMEGPQFYDHTYFEKTKSGFCLTDEKFTSFVDNYLGSVDLGNGMTMTCTDAGANYFVTDGRLSKSTVKLTLKGSAISDGVSVNYKGTASATCDYKDFGTTSVTIPDDLKTYMETSAY